MKIDYPLIIVIAGAFILGVCVGSYKPKHVPATLSPMESDETTTGAITQFHSTATGQIPCECKQITYTAPRFSPIPSWTLGKPSYPLELQQVQLKGIYFNESTMKLIALTIYGDYIEIDTKDIRLKKPK